MMVGAAHRVFAARLVYLAPAFLLAVVIGWVVWFTQFSWNALFLAAHRCDVKQVRVVLARGVSANARDPWGKGTVLMVASHNPGGVEACRALLDRGADFNATNAFGNTALMLAASGGNHRGGTLSDQPWREYDYCQQQRPYGVVCRLQRGTPGGDCPAKAGGRKVAELIGSRKAARP